MSFNLNHILRLSPVANDKKTCLTLIDNSSIVVEEPYAENSLKNYKNITTSQ